MGREPDCSQEPGSAEKSAVRPPAARSPSGASEMTEIVGLPGQATCAAGAGQIRPVETYR